MTSGDEKAPDNHHFEKMVQAHAQRIGATCEADISQTAIAIRRLHTELPEIRSLQDVASPDMCLGYAAGFLAAIYRELGPKSALELVETTPLDLLERRVLAIDRLILAIRENQIPFFTRSEFAERLDAFHKFLLKQYQRLVMTGVPSGDFTGCLWLGTKLGSLYPPRFAAGADEVVPRRMPFTKSEVKRLSALRGKLLDLKLSVVKHLANALTLPSADASSFLSRCIPLFREYITAGDAKICVALDRKYRFVPDEWKNVSCALQAVMGCDGPVFPGGLTDIIELIGHVEKEAMIGTVHRTKELLGVLLLDDYDLDNENNKSIRETLTPVQDDAELVQRIGEFNRVPVVNPTLRALGAYFQLMNPVFRASVDHAADLLVRCETEETDFLSDFDARVTSMLRDGLKWNRAVVVTGRKSEVAKVHPMVEAYARFATAHLKSTGKLPELCIASVESSSIQATVPENVFRAERGDWHIRFNGQSNTFPHVDGFHYLSQLLGSPGKRFAYKDLREELLRFRSTREHRSAAPLEDPTDVLRQMSDSGEILDQVARNDCMRRLDQIDEELIRATNASNEDRVSELTKERAFIRDELHKATGPRRQRRKMSPELKKTKDLVTKGINLACKKIGEKNQTAQKHLATFVKLDLLAVYDPEPEVCWLQ